MLKLALEESFWVLFISWDCAVIMGHIPGVGWNPQTKQALVERMTHGGAYLLYTF